jgi:predicted nucleic acid-binding protein
MVAETTPSDPPSLTLDSSVLIAICAKESDKYAVAHQELTRYANAGYRFFAPGVVIAEALFVLCRKLNDAVLSEADHTAAVSDLITLLGAIEPPPNGDWSLVARAEQIRLGYGCSRSADGIYIALAEELAANGQSELMTFDEGFQNQASGNAPSVTVRLLSPAPHT